jgi:hypothetical protein
MTDGMSNDNGGAFDKLLSEWIAEWKPDCGGDLDCYSSVLKVCLFTESDGHGSAWLYIGEEDVRHEAEKCASQCEAQTWCQNKAREWLREIAELLKPMLRERERREK